MAAAGRIHYPGVIPIPRNPIEAFNEAFAVLEANPRSHELRSRVAQLANALFRLINPERDPFSATEIHASLLEANEVEVIHERLGAFRRFCELHKINYQIGSAYVDYEEEEPQRNRTGKRERLPEEDYVVVEADSDQEETEPSSKRGRFLAPPNTPADGQN